MLDKNTPQRIMYLVLASSVLLAVVKIVAGMLGASWALVADGIESSVDLVGGLIVWSGLRLAARPADANHPYGHGRAETMAGMAVALLLVAAGIGIAIQSVREIATPHTVPETFTLWVLAGVIFVKELLFHWLRRHATRLSSTALLAEAWHHRGDALTSIAAFIGITIAIIGGPDYAPADDWAALAACAVILVNGVRLLRQSLNELMDANASPELVDRVREIAAEVDGVANVEKCRIRKAGLGLLLDLHVRVDGDLSVRDGHTIGHAVQDHLLASDLAISDVVIHLEPD